MTSCTVEAGPIQNSTVKILAFCAFFTTLPIYSPNIMSLHASDTLSITGYYAEPLLLVTAIIAFVCLVATLTSRSVAITKRLGIASCVLYLAGCMGFALTLATAPMYSEAIATICGLSVAIGVLPMFVAWSRVFSDLGIFESIVAVSISVALSVPLNYLTEHVSSPFSIVIYALLLLCGVGFVVVYSCRVGFEKNEVKEEHIETSSNTIVDDRDEDATLNMSVSRARMFLSVVGLPLVGMLIASFAMAVQPVYVIDERIPVHQLSMLLGVALLAPVAAFRNNHPLFTFIYRVYLGLASLLACVMCVAPLAGTSIDVSFVGIHAFYSMTSIVAIASACAIANAREFSRLTVVAAIVGAFCAMSYFGIVIGRSGGFEKDAYYGVLALCTVAYAAGLLLDGCVRAWRFTSRPEVFQGDMDNENKDSEDADGHADISLDERIVKLATDAGLSPRETEILGYVGRGHSSVYVAKNLLISESTVYTHVRNMYRKLQVSSKEELIQLVNAGNSGNRID